MTPTRERRALMESEGFLRPHRLLFVEMIPNDGTTGHWLKIYIRLVRRTTVQAGPRPLTRLSGKKRSKHKIIIAPLYVRISSS